MGGIAGSTQTFERFEKSQRPEVFDSSGAGKATCPYKVFVRVLHLRRVPWFVREERLHDEMNESDVRNCRIRK